MRISNHWSVRYARKDSDKCTIWRCTCEVTTTSIHTLASIAIENFDTPVRWRRMSGRTPVKSHTLAIIASTKAPIGQTWTNIHCGYIVSIFIMMMRDEDRVNEELPSIFSHRFESEKRFLIHSNRNRGNYSLENQNWLLHQHHFIASTQFTIGNRSELENDSYFRTNSISYFVEEIHWFLSF